MINMNMIVCCTRFNYCHFRPKMAKVERVPIEGEVVSNVIYFCELFLKEFLYLSFSLTCQLQENGCGKKNLNR